MGCKLCPQRSERSEIPDPMKEIRERSTLSEAAGVKVQLYLEGLECVCPTDPSGDCALILFIAGVSVCAIAGGVFGTFVPKACGFDAYEPMCTATAATIFTVLFTSVCDSNNLLEMEKETINSSQEVNDVLLKGVMTNDQFNVFLDEGQIEVEEWKSEEDDEVIFKVNDEAVIGAGTNVFSKTEMKTGDYISIGKTFKPKNNCFRFELEEWDLQAANNKLLPSPAGFYRVNALKDTIDFTKGSKNPGIYLVSTANKSIYVLYGRLEVV